MVRLDAGGQAYFFSITEAILLLFFFTPTYSIFIRQN
jgi:hypothetical protein